MTNPLVSVVIPAYNRAHTIRACIESIINQTYKNLEILVVDDCSTDNTVEVVRSFGDSRIKIIELENNSGAQKARNEGIKAASGEWIAFQDSDDEWYTEKIEKQVKILEENNWNKYLVVHSDGILQHFEKGAIKPITYPALNGENVYSTALSGASALFISIFASKQALSEIGFLDENVLAYQEWDTTIRLAKICKFVYIDEPLFVYNVHSGNTISKSGSQAYKGFCYILDKNKSDILKLCSYDVYESQLLYIFNKCLKEKVKAPYYEIFKKFKLKTKLKLIAAFILREEKTKTRRTFIILGFIKISCKKKQK